MAWLLGVAVGHAGCLSPECAHGDYYRSECRVAAENHYARLRMATGVELRFQEPGAVTSDTWSALGLFRQTSDAVLVARPAGLGDFSFSIDASGTAAKSITIQLENIAPDTVVEVGPAGAMVTYAAPPDPLLSRTLTVALDPVEVTWVRGTRPCTDVYRLVATGDVQTNPVQFERIVQELHVEAEAARDAGEPLMGMLFLGDLTENGTEDEFRHIRDILVSSPIPVATIPGNHDIVGTEPSLYNRMFGPGNYTFDVCGTRVAMLDSSNGDLAASVEGRLEELLNPGTQDFLIAGTHYPAWPGRTGAGFADEMQGFRLLGDLVRRGADTLFTGHVHTWRAFDDLPIGEGTIHQIITGTAGASQGAGQPHFGVTRITFGNAVQTCFVEVPEAGRPPGSTGVGDGALRRCTNR